MHRMLALAAVAASASLVGAAGGHAAAGPQCGDTITADVVLTHNLVCAGDGLIVDAAGGNVTINLGEYTIRGGGTSIGIRFVDQLGGTATVRNGTIRAFAVGIDATSFYSTLDFDDLSLVYND